MIDLSKLSSNSQAGQDLFVAGMLQGKKNGSFLEIGSNHLQNSNNSYLLEKELNWTGYSIDQFEVHTDKNYKKIVDAFWKNFYNNIKDSNWPDMPESITDLPAEIKKECINNHGYYVYLPKQMSWKIDRPLTTFIQADATKLDYSFLPKEMDYLQVDIDPPIANLLLLEKLLAQTRFATITFEHDLWRNTDEVRYVRKQSRIVCKKHGYQIVANDVTIEPGKGVGIDDNPVYFEDWYVHPHCVDLSIIERFKNITSELKPKYATDILFK